MTNKVSELNSQSNQSCPFVVITFQYVFAVEHGLHPTDGILDGRGDRRTSVQMDPGIADGWLSKLLRYQP